MRKSGTGGAGMRKSGVGSCGGLGNNKVTRVTPRDGAPAREMRPKGVSQIGSSRGNHATNHGKLLHKDVEPVRGKRMDSVPLGNEVARNVGKGGPGTGRTVFASGSQGQHGAPEGRGAVAGRDILSSFGPEAGGRR